MKKLFSKDSTTLMVYSVISLVLIGLSGFGFLVNSQFNFYPIVITTISFLFGGIYLFFSLRSMHKKIETTNSKGFDTAILMGGNMLRFLILVLSIVCNFLFIYFTPHDGEIEKWVYLLLLISGAPMFVNIYLFYLRGKYVE